MKKDIVKWNSHLTIILSGVLFSNTSVKKDIVKWIPDTLLIRFDVPVASTLWMAEYLSGTRQACPPSFSATLLGAVAASSKVLLRERVHCRGLGLQQQKKVYVRRTIHKESWEKIAPQIKNLQGKTPGWQVCRDTCRRMIEDKAPTDYTNCGRPAVIIPALQKWLVSLWLWWWW